MGTEDQKLELKPQFHLPGSDLVKKDVWVMSWPSEDPTRRTQHHKRLMSNSASSLDLYPQLPLCRDAEPSLDQECLGINSDVLSNMFMTCFILLLFTFLFVLF